MTVAFDDAESSHYIHSELHAVNKALPFLQMIPEFYALFGTVLDSQGISQDIVR